jgi:hypothetical protein
MLSEEEKKAIKVVNKRTERLTEELKIEEEDLIDEPKIAYLITQIEANKTLVNLIEKQQKEIEELKAKNEYREKIINGLGLKTLPKTITGFKELIENNDKKWEDKIKAKIEELEKIIEFEKPTYEDVLKYAIEVLQSLLEKE